MIKIKIAGYSTCVYVLTFMSLLIFSNGETAKAQDKNGIDEKRKAITKVKDTLIKLGDHVYAIISDGEAGNIAVYENPDGLVLVDQTQPFWKGRAAAPAQLDAVVRAHHRATVPGDAPVDLHAARREPLLEAPPRGVGKERAQPIVEGHRRRPWRARQALCTYV